MVAIFVALMFIGLVLTDLVLQKIEARRAARVSPEAAKRQGVPAGARVPWQVPEAIYLAPNHTWLSPQKSGRMALGADALVAHVLGKVRRVVLSPPGRGVQAGEPLFRLELNDSLLTVVSPITGTVSAVNARLATDPELLARDPYGAGWVCEVDPAGSNGKPEARRFGERAGAWLETEFARFREFLATQVPSDRVLGATSQDGGLPAAGCLAELRPNVWAAFEAEFLRLPSPR